MKIKLCLFFLILSAVLLASCEGHVHSWSEWTVVKQPSCAEAGSQERVCSCGQKETEEIPALQHNYGPYTVTETATCSKPGERERVCRDCGQKATAIIPVNRDNHSYGDWATVREPNCTEEGLQERRCELCGKTDETPIPAEGHSFTEWTVVREATCIAEGEKESRCDKCGVSETRTIAKSAHQYGDWHLADNVLCTTPGAVATQACLVCGTRQMRAIDGHSFTEATCTKPETCIYCGLQTGYVLYHRLCPDGKCERCNQLVFTKVVMPDLPIVCGHGTTRMRIDSLAYSYNRLGFVDIDFVGEIISADKNLSFGFHCELFNRTAGGTFIEAEQYSQAECKVGDIIRGRVSFYWPPLDETEPIELGITISDFQQ